MTSQNITNSPLPVPGPVTAPGAVPVSVPVPEQLPEAKPSREYFVNFNQDNTSLTVANKSGYRLYSLSNVETLEQIYCNGNEDSSMIERLFSSSLLAIVSHRFPRKLKVCHYKKGTEICNYSYTNAICGLKLNRFRLVVCLEESLYIHNIRDMKVLHTIRDTPRNSKGLCALSMNSDNCFLAYPGSSSVGEVQIFDTVNLQAKAMITAHDSPLAALEFSPCGTRIATASEKGTVIRIFSVTDSCKLYEFRRGVKRCVAICCLAFSLCGQYLSCSSNTETVHIFKLEDIKESPKSVEETSWMGYLSTYLPTQVTDVFTQGRAFATAHLPVFGCKNVLCVATIQQELRLLVATVQGLLFVYNIDKKNGGDLVLFKEHQIASSDTDDEDQADTNKTSSPIKIEGGILGSYAGIVKGNPMGHMSESEKLKEMAAASESPPETETVFRFTDEQEYPPLTQHSE